MLRLKRIMDAKNLSTKVCAAYLGIAEKTMYNKVMEESDLTYAEAKKLKALFPEYDLDYMLSSEPDVAPAV